MCCSSNLLKGDLFLLKSTLKEVHVCYSILTFTVPIPAFTSKFNTYADSP